MHLLVAGTDYRFFQIDDWKDLYLSVGNNYDEMWKINQKFLDEQILSGKSFYFSHDPFSAIDGTGFAREVNYLIDKGVKNFIKDGEIWKAIW